MENETLLHAHRHCSINRPEIFSSKICGCFYCMKQFPPSSIIEWTDSGRTSICPMCGIDSVLGDFAGFPITTEFLNEMHVRWFKTTLTREESKKRQEEYRITDSIRP